jgi:predicted nucleotidyltransferase component of viral defense system
MLTFEQLERYYPTGRVASSRSMLVEYVQHELLDSIFKQRESEHLSFIGGTAIRIVYQGSRFSEDLDFDNFGLSFDGFQKMVDAVVEDMRLKGFLVEFRTIEKGAYHCYVKFPHVLQDARLPSASEEKILVRIDMMKKEKIFSPTVYTLNIFDIYRNIRVNPPDILLSQKLITVLERKREKGRDFFDVSYLYGIAEPNFEYLEATTDMSKAAFAEKLFERCERLDFSLLAKDVEPFLMHPEQSVRVTDFKRFIRNKIENA